MTASHEIFGKDLSEVTLIDVQALVDQKVEENRILEYKDPGILENPKHLSEWISAFLNSEGGLIIIGVCEDKPTHKQYMNARIFPTLIKYVNPSYTKERIEQIIFSNMSCSKLPNMTVLPIRDSEDPLKTIFLIDIPQGDCPPYQAADNKYYRRLNVTKYPMAHYEIADFFSKRRKPKLSLQCIVSNPLKRRIPTANEVQERKAYHLQLLVRNTGNALAKHTRFVVSFENVTIEKVCGGSGQRIDDLRKGLPTLQSDHPIGVIYPGPGADLVWEIDVRLHKGRWGLIKWEVIAEDVELVQGNFVLLGLEFGHAGENPEFYYLQSYEQFFGTPPSRVVKKEIK